MVSRRNLLHTAAGASTVLLAGCLLDGSESFPLSVSVVNARDERFSAEMHLEDEDGAVLFEGSFDVPARVGDRAVMEFEEVATVSDGEDVQARVEIDGRTYEAGQTVTCSGGRPASAFRHVIYPGEEAGDGTGMELQALGDGRDDAAC